MHRKGRFILLPLLSIFCLSVILFSCSKSNTAPKSKTITPVISSLNTNTGPYYTSITITGTGFSATATDNQVFFNGKPAIVESATATTIYTRVPLSAGTGNITVTVNGAKATGPVFTYQAAEVVTSFAGNLAQGGADGSGSVASFYQPYGLAVDASGNIYVADQANNLIRKITPLGVVSTLAGSGSKGLANGSGASASFNAPTGLAVDASGNVYVTDLGNNLIRKITPAGMVSTLAGSDKGYSDGLGAAASFNRPTDVVVDGAGNLYLTDTYNYRIRKISPDGLVPTFAGSGSATSQDGIGIGANLDNPNDLAIDKDGNLYVSQADNLIRKITPGAVVTSIAGTVAIPITSSFNLSQGIAVDNSGNIYIENSGQYQIEKISPSGQISVFAGTGNQQYIPGVLSKASFNFMEGIVIDGSGNIYASEANLICKISTQ